MSVNEGQNWASMLKNNHTEGTTADYLSWAERFEDWRIWAEVSVSEDILYTFDEFLSDASRLGKFEAEYVDERSRWNTSRIPDDGYGYRTRVKAVSAIKSYVDFEYAVEFPDRQKYKVNNIVAGSEPPFDPVIASPDEVREIFEDTRECSFGSCHPMSRLAYDAIMRGIEVTRVEWDDVDLKHGRIYVRSAKGSPERWISLSAKTVDVLTNYRAMVKDRFENPKWMFYRFGGYRWSNTWEPQDWGEHFLDTHWDAGFHSFARHSSITNRLNSGESISDVSRRARHANLDNTLKYDQLVNNGGTPPELQ